MYYEFKNYLLRMRTKCQEEKYGNDGSRQIKMFPLNIKKTHFLKILYYSLSKNTEYIGNNSIFIEDSKSVYGTLITKLLTLAGIWLRCFLDSSACMSQISTLSLELASVRSGYCQVPASHSSFTLSPLLLWNLQIGCFECEVRLTHSKWAPQGLSKLEQIALASVA